MPTNTHPKFFPFLLAILGISGIILGVYRLYDGVYGTLRVPEEELVSQSDLENQSEEALVSSILTLQTQDTDDDGLTDYEELYSYSTSPYLKDSDSDGLQDLVELRDGTDPLCHKDQTCAPTRSSSEILDQLKAQIPDHPTGGAIAPTPPGGFPSGTATLSGEQLRQLLEQSGFPKKDLDTLSDEELEKKWREVIRNE